MSTGKYSSAQAYRHSREIVQQAFRCSTWLCHLLPDLHLCLPQLCRCFPHRSVVQIHLGSHLGFDATRATCAAAGTQCEHKEIQQQGELQGELQ